MGLLEKIIEIIGDEDKAKEVVSNLGQFMIPKDQYNKKVQELSSLKEELGAKNEELESIRVSSMSEQEKLKHEFDKANQLKSEFLRKTARLEAETLFVQAGLNQESYNDIIDGLVHEDLEQTKKMVGGVISVLTKEREKAIATTKEDVINTTPKPNNADGIETKPVQIKRFI